MSPDSTYGQPAERPADPPAPQPGGPGQGGDDTAELTSEDLDLLVRAAAEAGAGAAPSPARMRGSAKTAVKAQAAPGAKVGVPELPEFGAAPLQGISSDRIAMLSDVDLNVKIELGRTRMLVEDVLKLDSGSVVELDKLAGDPVDVFANDRLIARGEVLVLNDSFCVRISEVFGNDPHRVV